MAKISAHGHAEVVRVSKELPPDADDVVRRKVEYVVTIGRRGGAVRLLRRLVVWFAPRPYDGGNRRHDFGWKLKSARVNLSTVAAWADQRAAVGWTVRHGPHWHRATDAAGPQKETT